MAKWYPIYLDLREYCYPVEEGFKGRVVYRAPYRFEMWDRFIENENISFRARHKVRARFHCSSTLPNLNLKEVFVLKCKSKDDYLRIKMKCANNLASHPEDFVNKPAWLKDL